MASYSVGIDRSGLPEEEERHGPGETTMGTVAVPVAHVYPGLHATRLGALCPMGDRHGTVLGRAHHHPDCDGLGPGIALARVGACCRVWCLGSGGGRAAHAAADRAGTPGAMGSRSPGRRG